MDAGVIAAIAGVIAAVAGLIKSALDLLTYLDNRKRKK